MSRNTVISGAIAYDSKEPAKGRIRAEDAGRPRPEDQDPALVTDLDDLADLDSRGDPISPWRWTLKSTSQLAMGHQIGYRMVGFLLHKMGYSLQANAMVSDRTSGDIWHF